MSARGTTILGRFPRHLELDGRGKRTGGVVSALAGDLDTQTGQVGDVRTAHRLPDTPTPTDLLRLGGLHGLADPALDPISRRMEAISPVAAQLADDTAAIPDVDAAVDALADLLTADPDDFAAPGDGGEPRPAQRRLGQALAPLGTTSGRLEPLRRVVRSTIAAHRTGNGTPSGVLSAAAGYLGLEVLHVDHAEDRWWHLATCRDALAPAPLNESETPRRDLLALEENPPRPEDVGPTDRRHGEQFALVRGGLEAVPVTVVVRGIEDRTVAPMIVNVDTGSGVAFEDAVPADGQLRFLADGRVQLDGTAVGRRAYSFRGSVFADEGAPTATDFVFAHDADPATAPPRPVDAVLPHHTAHWAVTEPVDDAFASDGSFPHADGLVEPVWLARGRTRWAVFVGAGTYALRWTSNARIRSSTPRHEAGFFDRTVFEPDPTGPPSLSVGLEWAEREPFAIRLWIPQRFEALDLEGLVTIRERLRAVLDRHRAAGVHLSVAYADPRWILGVGVVRGLDSTDPRGLVITGTTAWPDETPQPSPT